MLFSDENPKYRDGVLLPEDSIDAVTGHPVESVGIGAYHFFF